MLNHTRKGQVHQAEQGKPLGRHDVPYAYDEHMHRKAIACIGTLLKELSSTDISAVFAEMKTEDMSGLVVPVPLYGRAVGN